MKRGRALVASGRVRMVLVVGACYLAWQGWLTLSAPAKIAASIPRGGAGTVDVLVTLPFAPERFHVLVFQRFGRVSGTRGTQVELRGVQPSDLAAVARPYWVSRVEPLLPDQRR